MPPSIYFRRSPNEERSLVTDIDDFFTIIHNLSITTLGLYNHPLVRIECLPQLRTIFGVSRIPITNLLGLRSLLIAATAEEQLPEFTLITLESIVCFFFHIYSLKKL